MKKKYEEKINEDKDIINKLEEQIKNLIKEKKNLQKNAEKKKIFWKKMRKNLFKKLMNY